MTIERGRFRAQATIGGARVSIGVFPTREQAEAALEAGTMEVPSSVMLATRRTPAASGRVIYFIRQRFHAIKIGSTRDLRRRLVTMQAMNADVLVVLATTPGTKRDEFALHRRFAAHRIHGEWFRPAPEVMELVRSLRAERAPVLQRPMTLSVGATFEI